jgi:enamine deaminase RidA (YjgF/YER057c/UK114 family)
MVPPGSGSLAVLRYCNGVWYVSQEPEIRARGSEDYWRPIVSQAEDRLREKGLELPQQPSPLAQYVSAVRSGNLVFISGHGPVKDGELVFRGKLGQEVDVDTGYQAAQLVTLNMLTSLKHEIGDLDRVRRVVKLLGMVNCTPDFDRQPEVINGASDLLVDVFGERGRHARSAVGMQSLPRGISVEIEMIVEVE